LTNRTDGQGVHFVLSEQDARAFCLAAAQVIPTLLVAFYVLDRMVKPKIDLPKDRRAPSYEDVKKNLKKNRKLNQRVGAMLIDIVQTKDVPSEEDMEHFALQWSKYEEYGKHAEELGSKNEELNKSRQDIIGSANLEQMKTYRVYLIGIFITILFGISGEAASVAGSLGALNLEVSIALASIAVFNIMGSLAVHSWHRLFTFQNEDKLTGRLHWWGLLAAQVITSFLLIVIVFNLQIANPS
jgi:hypothetical protein